MDYHSLKRKELQALCKEHNIPANSANSVLADKLSALLNETQKPKARQRTCMKSSVETTDEGEPAELKRPAKKVRFSPTNEMREYELRSGEKQKNNVTQVKTRRKSMAKKVNKPVVDNNVTAELVADTSQVPVRTTRSRVQSLEKDDVVPNNVTQVKTRRKPMAKKIDKPIVDNTVELVEDTAHIPVRATRSRVQSLGKDVAVPNNEKKKSRRGAKDVEKETYSDTEVKGNVGKVMRSKANTLQKGGAVQLKDNKQSKMVVKEVEEATESVEETVVGRTRSKEQTSTEGGTGHDASPQVKKQRDKQVKTDKNIVDIPVRATRSTQQTLKEDTGNNETKPEAVKKRTRNEMKATDLNSNSSHVAPVDKQEPPKRKSLRSRGVIEDEVNKTEVVANSRATRSKNNVNKVTVIEREEPLKHASKTIENRRKSVLQLEKTEVDPHLEEAVNHPARKNPRRKSVMPKATKAVGSPTVGKRQSKCVSDNVEEAVNHPAKKNIRRKSVMPKETKVVESPAVGKRQSKHLSDYTEDKEIVEVPIGTPRSRKRRGTPIIEDLIITETEYKFLGHTSPKGSTRSGSKSEAKPVAKNQAESSLKESMARMDNQSSVKNASRAGKSSAIRSGTIIKDSSSRKRAKLSASKQSDSEDCAVNSSKVETPVAKMRSLKLDEEVTEADVTPVNKSGKRFTRSTIKSERKESNRSTIKEPIAQAHMFSPKAAKFEHDPAFNTAPGRTTRSGFRQGGNAAGSFSEKVGKKKQTRQSARKKPLDDSQMASPKVAEVRSNPDVGFTDQSEVEQPLDEVKMSSPEVAEVQPNPDSDTKGVGSEISKEVTTQIIGDLSASESVRLSTKIMEENTGSISGAAMEIESVSQLLGENASGVVMEDADACFEKQTYEVSATPCLTESGKQQQQTPSELLSTYNETPSGKNLSHVKLTSVSMADVAETLPDAVFAETHVQNQNEVTPVNKSDKRFTRSTIKGERKETNQSTIPIAEAQLFSPKVAKFKPDPTVNTAPGRITRSRIKDGGYSAGVFSEKVGKKKQTRQSAHQKSPDDSQMDQMASPKPVDFVPDFDAGIIDRSEVKQPLDGVQLSSPEVAEVQPNPDSDTVVVGSGVSKEVTGQIFSDVSVADPNSETLTEIGSASPILGDNVFGEDIEDEGACIEKSAHEASETPYMTDRGKQQQQDPSEFLSSDNETSLAENVFSIKTASTSMADVAETVPDAVLDVSVVPNQSEVVHVESGVFKEAVNLETSVLKSGSIDVVDIHGDVRDDAINVLKELDTSSETSNADKTLDVHVSGIDINIEGVLEDTNDVQDEKSEHEQLTTNDNHGTDEDDVGGYDSEPAQNENMPVLAEVLVRSHDQEPEQSLHVNFDDVEVDMVEQSDVVTSKDSPKVLATGGTDDIIVGVDDPEEFVVDINKDVVSSILGDTYDVDDEGDDGNGQKLTEVNDDLQSNECGGIFPYISNEQTKEQAATTEDNLDDSKFMEDGSHAGVTEVGYELVGNINFHKDPIREEASPILNTKEEHSSLLTSDVGAHEGPMTKESSPITYENKKSRFDDIESDLPTTKEDDDIKQAPVDDTGSDLLTKEDEGNDQALVDDTGSDLPTTKEDDRNDQDETHQASTSVDWGDYDFGMDEFEKPVSANKSADVKDDQDSGVQTSARTSSIQEERNLENDSRNAADGKSNQEVDMLRGSVSAAAMAEEAFNWSAAGTSMKSLFATPAASRISDVRDTQEDAAKLVNQDSYSSLNPFSATPATTRIPQEVANSSLKSLFSTPATTRVSHVITDSSLKSLFKTTAVTQVSHVKDGQEDAGRYANQDPYSSLKPLFTTPATAQISHVKDTQAEATNIANKDHYSSLKSLFATPATSTMSHVDVDKDIGSSRTATHEFNHEWGNDQSEDFKGESQGYVVRGQENMMHGGPSFEDNFRELFEYEVGDSADKPGSNTHFEYKQLNEVSITSQHEPSGLNDNSTHSHEFDKKEDTLMKGSDVNDDLAFDTGHAHDYSGNNQ